MNTNIIKKTVAVCIASLILLTGCGDSKYDLSDTELSNAVGMKDDIITSSSIEFDKTTIDKAYPKLDKYTHGFERNGGTENIAISCNSDGVIIDVNIEAEGSFKSEYGIYGVHTGDTRESAERMLALKFGEDSASVLDMPPVVLLTYNDKKYGAVTVYVDADSGKVSGISLTRS